MISLWPRLCRFVGLLVLLAAVVSCVSPRTAPPPERFEFERPEMGMAFRIVLYAPDRASAVRASDLAFDRIRQLNDIMSDYDPDSELNRLARTSGKGEEVAVSPDLWLVLKRGQELSRRSGGAFDVTVGPYVNLWRRARRQQKLPEPSRLAQAAQSVGYQHVRMNSRRHTVSLLVPDMRLDLGGIAKGYAVGEAIQVLRKAGCRQALVEGGGDMVVGDPPPGKPGWRVELSSLDATNAPAARFLLLRNVAISTSGDLYQRLEIEGKRYSHIVDPRTGIGLTNHCVVNVIAREGIDADSLTKVVSVLGPEKGLPIVEATSGAVARIMRDPTGGRVETFESRRFRRFYAP